MIFLIRTGRLLFGALFRHIVSLTHVSTTERSNLPGFDRIRTQCPKLLPLVNIPVLICGIQATAFKLLWS
eukprot:504494-Heterocapsa_arctica.AAC.1